MIWGHFKANFYRLLAFSTILFLQLENFVNWGKTSRIMTKIVTTHARALSIMMIQFSSVQANHEIIEFRTFLNTYIFFKSWKYFWKLIFSWNSKKTWKVLSNVKDYCRATFLCDSKLRNFHAQMRQQRKKNHDTWRNHRAYQQSMQQTYRQLKNVYVKKFVPLSCFLFYVKN